MKTKIMLAFLMSVLLCVPVFAQTPVTVPNGDFESWTGGTSGPPDDWTNDDSNFSSTQEGTTVHDGSYSVNLTWTSQSNQDFLSDYISVTGDELYTTSYWAYDNDAAGRLRIFLLWYDDTYTYLSNNYPGVYTSDSAAWLEYTYAATAPTDAAYLVIEIRMYDWADDWDGDATVYLDDVTLTEGTGSVDTLSIYDLNYPASGGTCYDGPHNGDSGIVTHGIITGLYSTTTMVLQDADSSTYAGVWVYDSDYDFSSFSVGDEVYIAADVTEYYGLTELVDVTDVSVVSTGNTITPTTVDGSDITDACDEDDEVYENMLVKVEDVTIDSAASNNNYWCSDASGDVFYLDNDLLYTLPVEVGDEYLSITGIHKYTYSANRLEPRGISDFESAENIPPVISSVYYYPYPTVYPTDDANVSANISDDGTIASAQLYIQTTTALSFTPVSYDSISGDTYWFNVGTNAIGTLVEYYVEATDDESAVSVSDTFSFTVADPSAGPIPIYDIQYTVVDTPDCYPSLETGNTVTATGIVTATLSNNTRFFFQDADSAWSGIYVYGGSNGVAVGDSVIVAGAIAEYYGFTEFNSPTVTIEGTGTVYDPIDVTSDELGSSDCSFSAEPFEGMLVKLTDFQVTSGSSDYWGNDGSGDSCMIDNYLYDGLSLTIGETYDITGVVYYSYSYYRVYPRDASDIDDGSTPVDYSIYELNYPASGGTCYDGPHSGETGITTSGIVTGILGSGMALQDVDSSTYAGVWVYADSYDISSFVVGDEVTITADVTEYYGLTELTDVTDVTLISSGNTITPTTVDGSDITDACDEDDEAYENMLVVVDDVTIDSAYTYGNYWVSDASGDVFIIDNDLLDSLPVSVGDEYLSITGVHKYTYSANRLEPRSADDFQTEALECTATHLIYDLQSNYSSTTNEDSCYVSTYVDSGIVEVCGVVTAVDNEGSGTGLYIQDPEGTTYEGILWYDLATATDEVDLETAAIGDYYQVSATVSEYNGITELDSLVEFTLLGTNQPLPEITTVTISSLVPDFSTYCSWSGEAYEGVLVKIEDVVVGSTAGYDKWWITDSSSGADSILLGADVYDYTGATYPPGEEAEYDHIIGVMTYDYFDNRMKLQPRMNSDLEGSVVPPPSITAAFTIDAYTLCVMFDRALDQSSAETAGNYSITSGDFSVTAATLDDDLVRVFLSLSAAMGNGILDTITVSNVEDTLGNAMTSESYPFYQGFTPINMIQTTTDPGDDDTYPSDLLDAIVTMKGCIIADTTAFTYNNFYISDLSGTTNNGVLCYGSMSYWDEDMYHPVEGDTVVLTGQVTEYYGATEISNIDDYKNVYLVGDGVAEPTYKTYDAGDFQYNAFDAYHENFEGVLVQLCDSLEVVWLDSNTDTARVLIISLTDNADTIAFDGKYTNFDSVTVGDRIDGLTGVVRWRWGYFRLQPRSNDDFDTGFDCEGGGDEYEYLPGDANMASGSWPAQTVGGDVTYLVNYFRGLADACMLDGFYASADVTGDCLVVGGDVTYLVNYFRGLTDMNHCADYEPAWPTPSDVPVDEPDGWPNCDTAAASSISNGLDKDNTIQLTK